LNIASAPPSDLVEPPPAEPPEAAEPDLSEALEPPEAAEPDLSAEPLELGELVEALEPDEPEAPDELLVLGVVALVPPELLFALSLSSACAANETANAAAMAAAIRVFLCIEILLRKLNMGTTSTVP
jgi:hypothetical protein